MKTACIALACLLLAGCASQPVLLDSRESVASQVVLRDTSFDKFKTYTTPMFRTKLERNSLSSMDIYSDNTLSLLREKAGSKKIILALSSTIEYQGDWHYYSSASMQGGQTVQTGSASRTVIGCRSALIGCRLREQVVFELPAGSVKPTGAFAVRINAKSGPDIVVEVPAAYIEGLLQAALTR